MKYGDIINYCNPSQTHWEMNELLLVLERLGPYTNVLEIGTHQGGSAMVWKKALGALNVISLGNSRTDILDEHRPYFHYIHCGQGGSQSLEAYEQVVTYLEGQHIDFLFIDGGHRYAEVRTDFELYSKLVRPGGIIGFHDVWVEHEAAPDVEVKRFWLELMDTHKTITIRDHLDGQGGGTGIVFV